MRYLLFFLLSVLILELCSVLADKRDKDVYVFLRSLSDSLLYVIIIFLVLMILKFILKIFICSVR